MPNAVIRCSYEPFDVFNSPEAINYQDAIVYRADTNNHSRYLILKAKHDKLYKQFYGNDKKIDCSDECAFCLENLHTASENGFIEVIKIQQCQHVFHSMCLNKWRKDHGGTTCPICRCKFTVQNDGSTSSANDDNIWSGINRIANSPNNLLVAATAGAALGAAFLLGSNNGSR